MSNASVIPDRGPMLTLERAPGAPEFDLLTAREREVVKRAMLGSHNKAIAYDLGLSDSTIRVFMCRAASKLGVRSRRELLAKMTDLSAAPPEDRYRLSPSATHALPRRRREAVRDARSVVSVVRAEVDVVKRSEADDRAVRAAVGRALHNRGD